ncbi:MAG: hypothetical protein QUU85_15340, partial [Candidatus Eisenbacteria bacterium]|nr:hypothetical protein [Candidatus Eisenbacteria bacterium]
MLRLQRAQRFLRLLSLLERHEKLADRRVETGGHLQTKRALGDGRAAGAVEVGSDGGPRHRLAGRPARGCLLYTSP